MSNVIKSVSITKPTTQTNNQEVNTMESDNSFYQVLLDNISSLNTRIRNVPMGYNSQSFVSDNSCESNSSYNDIADKNILSGVNNNISDVNNEFRVEVTASDSETKSRIINAVKDASIKYEVDANLILAVIKKESSFNPNATSRSGAMGLMQIMPKNTAYLGVKNAYNIEENIDGGTKLLKEYIDKYNGDIEMALMAYNGGPTRMAQRGVKSASDIYKMPKETQNYVPTVMKFYKGEE